MLVLPGTEHVSDLGHSRLQADIGVEGAQIQSLSYGEPLMGPMKSRFSITHTCMPCSVNSTSWGPMKSFLY